MRRIHLLTSTLDAEVQALLDVHAAQTLGEFWKAARQVLHAALPVDAVWFAPPRDCWHPSAIFRSETAFRTESAFRRFVKLHPVGRFLGANPDRTVARLSNLSGERGLDITGFRREFMEPRGERFAAAMTLSGPSSSEALVGLHRSKAAGDFTGPEVRVLGELRRQLGAAFWRVASLHCERARQQTLEDLVSTLPLPVAVLGWGLEELFSNEAARRFAKFWASGREKDLLREADPQFEIPADIRGHCLEIQANNTSHGRRGREGAHIPRTALEHQTVSGVQATVRLQHLDASAAGMPVFMVGFSDLRKRAAPGPLGARQLGFLAPLTAHEREVALMVTGGRSNGEVASALGKSESTVKAQLQSCFRKLGVTNRGQLTAFLQRKG